MAKDKKNHYIAQFDMKNFGSHFDLYEKNSTEPTKTNLTPKSLFWKNYLYDLEWTKQIKRNELEKNMSVFEGKFKEDLDSIFSDLDKNIFTEKSKRRLIDFFNLTKTRTLSHLKNSRSQKIKSLNREALMVKNLREKFKGYEYYNDQNLDKSFINKNYEIHLEKELRKSEIFKNNYSLELIENLQTLFLSSKEYNSPKSENYDIWNGCTYILRSNNASFIINDLRFSKIRFHSHDEKVLFFPISKKYCLAVFPKWIKLIQNNLVIDIKKEFLNLINWTMIFFSDKNFLIENNSSFRPDNDFKRKFKKHFLNFEKFNDFQENNLNFRNRNLLAIDSELINLIKKFIPKEKYFLTDKFKVNNSAFSQAVDEIGVFKRSLKIEPKSFSRALELYKINFKNLQFEKNTDLFLIHYFKELIKFNLRSLAT